MNLRGDLGAARFLLKRGFSLLLLLAFTPTFLNTQNENNPLATQTFTGTYTHTNSTIFLSPTNVTTQVEWTSLQFYTLTSSSMSIDPTMGKYRCVYDNLAFTATKGERLLGSLESNIQASFYLLSESNYNAWVSAGHCAVQNDLARRENATMYLLDVIVPEDGTYDLVVLNFSPYTSASVNAIIAGSSPQGATLAVTWVSNVTLSTTFTYTQEIAFAANSQGMNWGLRIGYALLFLGTPVLIIALLIVTIRRRRSRIKAPSAFEQSKVAPEFCVECGAQLKSGVKFCSKCGTAVNRQP